MAEPDREAYEAAERLVREAHARAEEAARAAAAASPPNGWSSGERRRRAARSPTSRRCSRWSTRCAARSRPSSRASSPTRCASCCSPSAPCSTTRSTRLERPPRERAARWRTSRSNEPARATSPAAEGAAARRRGRRRARALAGAALVPEVVLPGRQGRPGQRQRARRLHVRRGRGPAGRGRGPVPRLGALAAQGLPPARAATAWRSRSPAAGPAAARLAAVRQARHPGRGRDHGHPVGDLRRAARRGGADRRGRARARRPPPRAAEPGRRRRRLGAPPARRARAPPGPPPARRHRGHRGAARAPGVGGRAAATPSRGRDDAPADDDPERARRRACRTPRAETTRLPDPSEAPTRRERRPDRHAAALGATNLPDRPR